MRFAIVLGFVGSLTLLQERCGPQASPTTLNHRQIAERGICAQQLVRAGSIPAVVAMKSSNATLCALLLALIVPATGFFCPKLVLASLLNARKRPPVSGLAMQSESHRGTEMLRGGHCGHGATAIVSSRRAAITAGSGLLALTLLGVDAANADSGSAVERMRARRKAVQTQVTEDEAEPAAALAPAAANEEEGAGPLDIDIDDVKEGLQEAGKVAASAAAATKKLADTATPLLKEVATTTYKFGKDVAIPAAKKAAETSAPVVIDAAQKGANQAGPLLQAGASKVGPAVQGMVQSEAFKQATSGVQPLVREGAETIDKVVNDPTVKSAISAAETSITETAKAAQPYLPVAAKGAASAGKAVAGALSWSADMVNTLSTKGGEAAGEQLMDTLKSGAQNGAKFTQEVVVPVTKDVVLPAAKKSLNFAVETSGKALGEAKKAALETPNGQAMSQKVTGISSQVTGAVQDVTKQAASTADQVTGKVSGVGRTIDQAVNAAAGTADQVLDKAGDALQGAATKVVDKADQVTDKAADVIDRAVGAAAGTTDQVRDAAAGIAGKKPN